MDPSTQRVLTAMDRTWDELSRATGHEPFRIDGWLAGSAGTSLPMCNQAQLHARAEQPDRSLRAVLDWYGDRGCMLQISDELDPASHAIAAEQLTAVARLPLMTTPLTAIPDAPEAIRVTQTTTETDLEHGVRIAVRGFDAPEEGARAFAQPATLHHPSIGWFLAWDGDTPVATGTSFLADGVVGLFSIATIPEARGRGAGAAITIAMMREAREAGADLAYLQSSEMGFRIYERAGFRTVMHSTTFVRP